jgi:hypothetical protein
MCQYCKKPQSSSGDGSWVHCFNRCFGCFKAQPVNEVDAQWDKCDWKQCLMCRKRFLSYPGKQWVGPKRDG